MVLFDCAVVLEYAIEVSRVNVDRWEGGGGGREVKYIHKFRFGGGSTPLLVRISGWGLPMGVVKATSTCFPQTD